MIKKKNMKKQTLTKFLPHIAAIAVFLILTVLFFYPIVFEGKDLPQGDVTGSLGWGNDLREYHQKTGDYAFWSNAMFGGMPANYTYMPETTNIFREVAKVFTFFLPRLHIGILFAYMLGFYILLLAMGCSSWLSGIGAVAYAFTSYNLIIIDAGHVNQALVIATMAPLLGGAILCYRGKYLWGSITALIFTGLNIFWGHQQISYYLFITIIILAITYFVYSIKEKALKKFFTSSAILLVVAILGISPSLGSLIPTMDYTKDTMRGGAVLKKDKNNKKEKSGLDIDYAYAWSYGKGETMTLLIPNFKGASSHYNIGNKSNTYKALRRTGQARSFCRYAPTYWGEQPFTAGPVYAGAIICFLFILGLFIVKGPEKWWILAATVLSIIMSWGRNFAVFNNFIFYHLPLYNKFRTPAMSLVITNMTMALMAILAIKEIIKQKGSKELLKNIYISGGITAGICLIYALFGKGLLDFSSLADQNYPAFLTKALKQDRAKMLSADAWRSFFYIALSFIFIILFIKKKIKKEYLFLILGILIFTDLFSVDKRFINESSYQRRSVAKKIEKTEADKLILRDKNPDYRVLNLTSDTFNEARTSYFHKSIGGYSPAKLRRYQDIIDFYLSGNINMNVLNMLNTKYIIVKGKSGNQVQQNPYALGNAWFVDTIKWVNSPDEEIAELGKINPASTAVIDNGWKDKIKTASITQNKDTTKSEINLEKYANPGNLIYKSDSPETKLAVFSEVFYKTWYAYIDGKEAPIVRVNYILRGLEIPAGKHTIEFKCVDKVFNFSSKIALIASIIVSIIIIILLFIGIKIATVPQKEDNQDEEALNNNGKNS